MRWEDKDGVYDCRAFRLRICSCIISTSAARAVIGKCLGHSRSGASEERRIHNGRSLRAREELRVQQCSHQDGSVH